MKEEITQTRCDICNRIIDQPGKNCMIWPAALMGQVWPTSDGDKDVCAECCSILSMAADLGMIEIDKMAYFYARAGFVWKDDHWILEPVVVTEDELIAVDDMIGESNLCSSG